MCQNDVFSMTCDAAGDFFCHDKVGHMEECDITKCSSKYPHGEKAWKFKTDKIPDIKVQYNLDYLIDVVDFNTLTTLGAYVYDYQPHVVTKTGSEFDNPCTK
jgi:hypothetical protein